MKNFNNDVFSWFLIPTLLVLAGCVEYQSAPISSIETARSFDGRNLADAELKKFIQKNLDAGKISEWPPKEWSTEILELVGVYFRPEIKASMGNVELALAQLESSQEDPNPVISWNPQYDTTVLSPTIPWTIGAGIDFTIETGGKKAIRKAEGDARIQLAKLELAKMEWQVRSEIKKAIIDLVSSRLLATELSSHARVISNNLEILKSRFNSGTLSGLTITEAEAAEKAIKLGWIEAESQLEQAESRLADALGVPRREVKNLEISPLEGEALPKISKAEYEDLRCHAIRSQPDILISLAQYAIAEQQLRAEIAKQYPDIHLGPEYTWDQGSHKWSIGFSLSLPILNQNQGAIAEAEARRIQAGEAFNTLQSHLMAQIDIAYTEYSHAFEKAEIALLLEKSERDRLHKIETSRSSGEVKRAAIQNAQLDYFRASESRIEFYHLALLARQKFKDTLQIPLMSEGQGISLNSTSKSFSGL